MPTLTLISMIPLPVTVTIDGRQRNLDAGGRLAVDTGMNQSVNLAGRVTGPQSGLFRPAEEYAYSVVQDTMLRIDIEPNSAELRFSKS
jgi:hypothetical protein